MRPRGTERTSASDDGSRPRASRERGLARAGDVTFRVKQTELVLTSPGRGTGPSAHSPQLFPLSPRHTPAPRERNRGARKTHTYNTLTRGVQTLATPDRSCVGTNRGLGRGHRGRVHHLLSRAAGKLELLPPEGSDALARHGPSRSLAQACKVIRLGCAAVMRGETLWMPRQQSRVTGRRRQEVCCCCHRGREDGIAPVAPALKQVV